MQVCFVCFADVCFMQICFVCFAGVCFMQVCFMQVCFMQVCFMQVCFMQVCMLYTSCNFAALFSVCVSVYECMCAYTCAIRFWRGCQYLCVVR